MLTEKEQDFKEKLDKAVVLTESIITNDNVDEHLPVELSKELLESADLIEDIINEHIINSYNINQDL